MMNIEKIYNRLERYFIKKPVWFNILLILACLFILVCIYKSVTPKREGFTQQTERFQTKKGVDIYDNFYVGIYDQLFYREMVNIYEVGSIQNITKPTTESNILLIGSGTGHVAEEFNKLDIKITGLDESKEMVSYAKEEYPTINFKVGTPMQAIIFNQEQFTHIVCLSMNYYYYKDKNTFLQNVYSWLKPGGFFVVQLVDKNKFDPVVPAGKPFVMVNPQKFAKKRITESTVIFNNFEYNADFEIFPNDFVQFKEVFKDTTPGSNKVRQNIHKMWIPSRQKVINQCKEIGFINYAQVDLLMTQLEHQYLYIFQKPS